MNPGAGDGRGQSSRGLARFRRALGLVGAAELWLAATAFAAVVCLTIVQVTLRYVFASSLWWGQEVSQMMIMVSYFLGISYVYKTRQYIVISWLFDRISARLQLSIYLLAQVLIIGFCAVVVFELIAVAPNQLDMRTVILHIPRFYGTLPLMLASVSMIATALYYFFAVWRQAGDHPQEGLLGLESRLLINQPVGEL